MAVQEALVGRTGRRVVVQARPLDVRAVALRRGVVQGEQQRSRGGDVAEGGAEQQSREQVGAAGEGGEEVVLGGETGTDAGGAEPAGDGAATLGEEGPREEDAQAEGVALVQTGRQAVGKVLPKPGEKAKIHGGSPGWDRGRVVTPILAREPSSDQKWSICLLIGG